MAKKIKKDNGDNDTKVIEKKEDVIVDKEKDIENKIEGVKKYKKIYQKRVKNISRQPLVIALQSGSSVSIGNREISRPLTQQEFNSPAIQRGIKNKFLKIV